MIIVLAVGLTLLGLGGRWWKRRHDRKRDALTSSFNAGITTRSAPPPPPPAAAMSQTHTPEPVVYGNIRDGEASGSASSPARTREAYMPYGYGYTRSESRSESRVGGEGGGFGQGRTASPLARGATPMGEMERGEMAEPGDAGRGKRRVLVREREREEGL